MFLLLACAQYKTPDTGDTAADADTDTDSDTDTDADTDTDTDTDTDADTVIYYATVVASNQSPWTLDEVYVHDYYGGRLYDMLSGNPMEPGDERSMNVEAGAFWEMWAILDDTCAGTGKFSLVEDEVYTFEILDFEYSWDEIECY